MKTKYNKAEAISILLQPLYTPEGYKQHLMDERRKKPISWKDPLPTNPLLSKLRAPHD